MSREESIDLLAVKVLIEEDKIPEAIAQLFLDKSARKLLNRDTITNLLAHKTLINVAARELIENLILTEDYERVNRRGKLAILAAVSHLEKNTEENSDSISSPPISKKHDPSLEVSIDPGSAPPEVIEEILARLSILNRKMGGNGINFTLEDIFTDKNILA